MTRCERFACVERGDITILLPWLMGHTRRASTTHCYVAREATDDTKFKRASSASRHPGRGNCSDMQLPRATVSARQRGNVGACQRQFPDSHQTSVSEAATAAVAASAYEPDKGGGPKWHTEEECDPQVAFEEIKSLKALSGAGSDGLHFSRAVNHQDWL